jgi:hypothetical protein
MGHDYSKHVGAVFGVLSGSPPRRSVKAAFYPIPRHFFEARLRRFFPVPDNSSGFRIVVFVFIFEIHGVFL